MDIRKVKKLIELLEESNIGEIEIKEGEESVRISRHGNQPAAPVAYAAPAPAASATPPPARGVDCAGEVAVVEGSTKLAKLTFAEDFAMQAAPVRTGTGFDVHQLVEGEELWLGGVRIAFLWHD